MTALITLDQILILAVSNLISGIFIGLGIAGGLYHALKKQMPRWIHETTIELRKMVNVEKALNMQRENKLR